MTTTVAQNQPQVSLAEKRMLTVSTLFGAMWSTSSRLFGRMLDFAVLLFLARTLAPADFGLTALALSVITVTDTLLDVPLVQALTSLKTVEKRHLDTAFTIALLRGLAVYAALALVSWPAAVFYGDPRLMMLIPIMAIGPAVKGLLSPRIVEYIRSMRFRPVFLLEVGGKLIAASLTLLVAVEGGGYWAIVANGVVTALASVLLSYLLAPFRPAFSLEMWRDFRSFLGWMSLSQLVSSANWQLDRIILGRFVSKSTLGQYTMAGDIAVLPTQTLIGPAMSPLMAAFTQVQNDGERLRKAYLKASQFVMMIAAPACIGISLLSGLLTDVLLGPKWALADEYLRWIPLTLLFTAYIQPLSALAFVRKRTDIVFRLNLTELLIRLGVVAALSYVFLVPGAIAGRAAIAMVVFALTLHYARSMTGASIAAQLRQLVEIAIACAGMAVIVVVAERELMKLDLPEMVDLGLLAGLGAGGYFVILHGLGVRLRSVLPRRS